MGIPEIQTVVSRLGREYGAQRIWLFGSYARGDMSPASDIDLRIDKGRIRGVEMGGLLLDGFGAGIKRSTQIFFNRTDRNIQALGDFSFGQVL